jgi:hypothetical protein
VRGQCRSCGDERVRGNAELRKACHPDNSSGPQIGGQSSEFAAVMLHNLSTKVSGGEMEFID